jgi:phosphoribosylaminoimidazole (AIR) synthetase
MFGTFNMGIGLVVAADSGAAGEVMDALRKSGEAPCRAGEVRARKEGAAVVIEGVEP